VCVAAHFRGTDAGATQTMRSLLDEWAASMPSGAATVTSIDDRTVAIESCDPGQASAPSTDVATLLAAPTSRLAITNEMLVRLGVDFDDAWCVGDRVVDEFDIEELSSSDLSPDAQQRVLQVMMGCGLQPG
jgi:hypothetical protein